MSWTEGMTAVSLTFSVIVNTAISVAWLFLAWRLLSWFIYEKSAIERTPAQNLRFAVRQLVCRHRRGYAHVQDSYGRNYTACNYCGKDVNQNRRMEDRV